MATDNEQQQQQQPPIKKRRLSRKEQKEARKKQKRRAQNTEGNSSTAADDNYSASYVPTPIPTKIAKESQQQKSVGKWFPKAVKLKRHQQQQQSQASCSILLFYQYVTNPVLDDFRCSLLMQYLLDIGKHRPNLAGRIRIAPEGLNCTLSAIDNNAAGAPTTTTTAAATLRHFAMDLRRFDETIFQSTDFKYSDGLTADRHFAALTVIPVKELVYYGLSDEDAPLHQTGTHVSPQQFHAMLAGGGTNNNNNDDNNKETVVIDVRNHYEAAIGRFDGQQQQQQQQQTSGAAQYVDPKMRKSTDFPNWLKQPDTQQMLSGKQRVLLFCTGGIRCERASAHLNHILLNSNSIKKPPEVYQLQGGIERYMQEFPDGGFWRGSNFTFDKREAVRAGDANGEGGVIDVKKKKKKKKESNNNTIEGCVCVVCKAPWDRYVGKKKCSTCGVPVLMCDACMSKKKELSLDYKLLRCPLCVEQNVTVRAKDVDWTNNGVSVVVAAAADDSSSATTTKDDAPKAAPTVLKWGGGYATDKKVKRKWKRTPCRFGADCVRKDCYFAHPNCESNQSALPAHEESSL